MKLAATPHERTIDVDISSDAFWAMSFEERDELLRAVAARGAGQLAPADGVPVPPRGGRLLGGRQHDDINMVSRQTQRFGSRFGVSLDPVRRIFAGR